ncbi:MAG: glycine zipper family protein [Candidatus Moranbacteria bacterium]|nr:glycine zipper family protein [Candidatus Moranbacteria bacterium]
MKNSTFKKRNLFILSIAAVLISGCAQVGGWRPTVDSYNDPHAYRLGQDMAECRQLASQAGSTGTETALQAGSGALIGAAGGAIAGAFLGNPGTGAAVGAAAGGFGGGAKGAFEGDSVFKNAYKACLRNRGHNVIGLLISEKYLAG